MVLSARLFSGQPRVENGHSADENQVSRMSPSWRRLPLLHVGHAVGSWRATITSPHSQYQAGMRWPHHSWREMHQSLMLVIQCMYVFVHSSGTNFVLPCSTALTPSSASVAAFTHH